MSVLTDFLISLKHFKPGGTPHSLNYQYLLLLKAQPFSEKILEAACSASIDRPMKLEGNLAIVTGASRGVGSAIARKFASEDPKVVVNYNKSERKASRLVDEIRKTRGEAIPVKADVSRSSEVKRLVKETGRSFGRVNILVNNAGVMRVWAG